MDFRTLFNSANLAVPTLKIIDIGAGLYNTNLRYQPILDQNLAHVIGFEPNQKELDNINETKTSVFTYLPHAVGDGKPGTFYETALPQCSSLYKPNHKLLNLFSALQPLPNTLGAFGVVSETPMATTRLDDVPECANADYIKIDVQGGELDIIQHAPKVLATSLVLELEVEFVEMYEQQPLFGDIQCFLRDSGFTFHKMLNIQGRPFAPVKYDKTSLKTYSQALWADGIFIADALVLDPLSLTDEQLIKSAILLHEVYQSYDLVHYLMANLDTRHNSNLAKLYIDETQKQPLKRSYMNLIDDVSDLKAG